MERILHFASGLSDPLKDDTNTTPTVHLARSEIPVTEETLDGQMSETMTFPGTRQTRLKFLHTAAA